MHETVSMPFIIYLYVLLFKVYALLICRIYIFVLKIIFFQKEEFEYEELELSAKRGICNKIQ